MSKAREAVKFIETGECCGHDRDLHEVTPPCRTQDADRWTDGGRDFDLE